MGDRANIAIEQGDGSRVYLYGHWMGEDMPSILQSALARKQRWDDTQYLARIIFCQMVSGHERGETGFGISTTIGDNSYPVAVVDPEHETLTFEEADGISERTKPVIGKRFTFGEFITLPNVSWGTLARVG